MKTPDLNYKAQGKMSLKTLIWIKMTSLRKSLIRKIESEFLSEYLIQFSKIQLHPEINKLKVKHEQEISALISANAYNIQQIREEYNEKIKELESWSAREIEDETGLIGKISSLRAYCEEKDREVGVYYFEKLVLRCFSMLFF